MRPRPPLGPPSTLVVLLFLSAGAAGAAPETLAVELREAALGTHGAFDIVHDLTVTVGPRFAGTDGDRRAVAWAVETMEELGFDRVTTEPVTVPRWVRGEAEGAIVSPHHQPMVLTALGGSVGTPAEGIEAPVLRVESIEALESLSDEEVAGRIVFFDRSMERRRDGRGYGETVPIRSRGPAAAAAKGAVAVVIRSVGTGTHRFPHTGGTRYGDGPRIPAAALAVPDADILAAQLATGDEVVLRLRLTCRMLDDGVSANVIGELRGREKPEEIVLLGAHLDSWDLGTGAVDDGAGVAAVLQAARLVAGLPVRPRRTIRVVLFANEEFGLSGAREYAARREDEIPAHVLAVESDFGAGRVWRFAARLRTDAMGWAAGVHELLAPLGIEWHGDAARGGADLIPLRREEVPIADLTPDGTYYFDVHHTIDDTIDKVDPDDLAQHSAAYAVLAWMAAESDVETRPAPEWPEE